MTTPMHYDDTPRAWEPRDAMVRDLTVRFSQAQDADTADRLAAQGLGLLSLAAEAGQTDRLTAWALALGEAQTAAFERRIGGVR